MTIVELALAGYALTAAQRDAIAAKFRTEIGGVYDYVAAAIEYEHRDAE